MMPRWVCLGAILPGLGAILPGGGAAPPNPPLFSFCFLDRFGLKLGRFLSTPQKFSLPPLDRARRSDSDAPNESSVAQIYAPFRPVHVEITF